MQSATDERQTDRRSRGQTRALFWTAGAALLFLAGSLLAPLLQSSPGADLLRVAYAPLCHQRAERSLEIGSGTQAVCARCSGLYAGATIGLFAAALGLAGSGRRLRPWMLAAALTPTAIDALVPWVGLSGLPNLPRLWLAAPAGFVTALFLAVGVADLVAMWESRRTPRPIRVPSRPVEEVDA